MSRRIRVLLILTILLSAFSTTVSAEDGGKLIAVKLELNGKTKSLLTACATVGELLESEGLIVDDKDILNLDLDEKINPFVVTKIKLQQGFMVNLVLDGEEVTMKVAPNDKVGHIIEEANKLMDATYFYDGGFLNDDVVEGQTIELYSAVYKEVIETEVIPFERETVYNETRPIGTEVILRLGTNGEKNVTWSVAYRNEVEISRVVKAEEITTAVVNEVLEIGTYDAALNSDVEEEAPLPQEITAAPVTIVQPVVKGAETPDINEVKTSAPDTAAAAEVFEAPLVASILTMPKQPGVLKTKDGEIKYSLAIELEATAYSPEQVGMNEITAVGLKPEFGIAAVDPKKIPLGTKMYIEGYGFAVAADTGSAIIDEMIDLCFDTVNECIEFGRKKIKVYIIAE